MDMHERNKGVFVKDLAVVSNPFINVTNQATFCVDSLTLNENFFNHRQGIHLYVCNKQ